jgi:hypothetical protein
MLEPLRKAGGRAYALAAFAIIAILLLSMFYLFLITYGITRETDTTVITPELFSPLIFAIVVIGGLGGAQTLPNIAERWGGAQPRDNP